MPKLPVVSGKKVVKALSRIGIDTSVFLNVLNKDTMHYQYSKGVLLAVETRQIEAIIPTLVISEILTGFYIEKRNNQAK